MKIIRCIDIETTSTKDPPDAAICEVGWVDVVMEERDGGWWPTLKGVKAGFSLIVNAGMPIDAEARAVHHISDADVRAGVALSDAIPHLTEGADFYAAHSAAYEKKFLAGLLGDRPWICTLKAARRVWPNAPAHGLQVLRYWRNLEAGNAWPPHRAGPDAFLGGLLLVDLIKSGASVRDMVAWERLPSLLPGAIRFGKHKGVAWKDAPSDYLEWIVNKSDMDEDAKFTAAHWLKEVVA